ncbi:helix-turn-helix domain-containing protein [Providencia vermicola]|uniref:helix-turn-helix domain-containing protein n=1 Tax=Providencia vermicola TaxID=333965 RepID=UPI002AB4CA20|nr:helix-turn-helix transcriptional regulator [Providencia stuartii]
MKIQQNKYPLAYCVGQRIRILRKKYGMTANELAEQLNVSQQQFSRYERGVNRIDIDSLALLSYFFNVSIHYFFEGIDFTEMQFIHSDISFSYLNTD